MVNKPQIELKVVMISALCGELFTWICFLLVLRLNSTVDFPGRKHRTHSKHRRSMYVEAVFKRGACCNSFVRTDEMIKTSRGIQLDNFMFFWRLL